MVGGSGSARRRAGGAEVKRSNYGYRLRALVEADQVEDFSETCSVCDERPMVYAAITGCRHSMSVCWLCVVRMRRMLVYKSGGQAVVVRENKCVYCDADQKTLLSKTKRQWCEVDFVRGKRDDASHCYCADDDIYNVLQILQDFRCWVPECDFGWTGDQVDEREWKQHLWEVHKRKLCETCYEARKSTLFPAEMNLYLDSDLGRHRKYGDDDRNAHYFCRVCHQWLFDEYAFERHWRESDSHEMCSLCYADGFRNTLFNSMDNLRQHWQTSHFPCLEESCEEKHTVFRDSRSLQLHMAKEHLRSSSFFEHVGRRGILLRLDQPSESEPFINRHSRRANQETSLDDDAACALWPMEMIAEAPKLLESIQKFPTEYFATFEQCQAAASSWYHAYSKSYFDKVEREIVTWNCHKAHKLAQRNAGVADIEAAAAGVTSCVQSIVHLISKKAAAWKAKSNALKQIQDGDPTHSHTSKSDESHLPPAASWPHKRPVNLSRPSEILLAIILAIPKKDRELKAAFVEAVTNVAKRSAEAAQALAAQEQAHSPHTSAASPMLAEPSPDQQAEEDETQQRQVLADCEELPINRNISFIVASEWAILEYLRRLESRGPPPPPVKCPNKVPISVLERMRATYTKEDFTTFSKLSNDLGEYIENAKLTAFMSLRPWYMIHKLQVRRTYLPPGSKRRNGERNRAPLHEAAQDKHSPHQLSRKWGQRCDQAFYNYHPQQLQLLRQYCAEARSLLPSAMAPQAHLVGGVERRELLSGDNPPLPEQGRVLNTRTRQFVPQSGSRTALNPDDFPTLSASSNLAASQTASSAWRSNGSPSAGRLRANGRGQASVPQTGAVTRMAEPPQTAEQFPALRPSRAPFRL